MRYILINLLLTELVIFIGVFLLSLVQTLYKQSIPKSPFEDDIYDEDDDTYVDTHEEILDEGFIEEQNIYNSRISDMKEKLKEFNPAIEIITDEYERSIER